jgi:hypothetical protein
MPGQKSIYETFLGTSEGGPKELGKKEGGGKGESVRWGVGGRDKDTKEVYFVKRKKSKFAVGRQCMVYLDLGKLCRVKGYS